MSTDQTQKTELTNDLLPRLLRDIRTEIDDIIHEIRDLKKLETFHVLEKREPFKSGILIAPTPLRHREETGEMIANATLAIRHLEDARMRLGKVIQWHDGGTSCYDKEGGSSC